MTIPGMSQLLESVKILESIKTLENYARAERWGEDLRLVLVTAEEADVIESFRRFKAQDY
jgi:hypothetical protein